MNLTEAADRVIALSRKVIDYYEAESPKRHPHYPLVYPEEGEVPPPPEEKELHDLLKTLPEDTIYQLAWLVHLYWGYFGVETWPDYRDTMMDLVGTHEQAIDYLAGRAVTLADELSDVLADLRERKIHLDKTPSKRAKVRKR